MNFLFKRLTILTALLIAAVVCIGGNIAASESSGTTLEALEDMLAAATSQRQNAEKAVANAESGYADALARKKAIDGKIYALNLEIDAINQLIAGYNLQIEEKNVQIAEAEIQLQNHYEIVKQRIRAKREDGGLDILSIFFEANALERLLVELDRFMCMLDYDKTLLDDYNDGLKKLQTMRDELKAANDSLNKQMVDLESLSATLQTDLANANKLVATAENKLSSAEADLANVEKIEAEYEKKRKEMLAGLKHTTNDSYVGGEFAWPLPGNYTKVSSGFGWRIHPVTGVKQFHRGIDIPAPYGTEIMAINSGTVVECSYNYADGYYITVNHGGGLASFYSHLSKYHVKVGDKVTQGQVIANVGTSGYTTGAHLNLNMYIEGNAVNPLNYLKR